MASMSGNAAIIADGGRAHEMKTAGADEYQCIAVPRIRLTTVTGRIMTSTNGQERGLETMELIIKREVNCNIRLVGYRSLPDSRYHVGDHHGRGWDG